MFQAESWYAAFNLDLVKDLEKLKQESTSREMTGTELEALAATTNSRPLSCWH